MKYSFTLLAFLITTVAFSQTRPIVYVNFVSHNEPNDSLDKQKRFDAMNTKVLQLAQIMKDKNATWNLQTCDAYAMGALTLQGKTSNIFKTLATTYAANVQIDPRYKTSGFHNANNWNVADTYHILDSLGANPTQTLGGFVYSTQDQGTAAIDWFTYQDTITGKTYKKVKWKANLMWGAGSYKPHTNDLNDWGIFKPDTVSYTATQENFLRHNPERKLWYIGNGCQPLYALDSTENEQTIIDELRSFLNDIENKVVPQNKFYVFSITINQSGFGPTLFSKISTICDTINAWGSTKMQWKTLTEKFSLFEDWQKTSGLDHSQWLCGEVSTATQESVTQNTFSVFPNPAGETCTVRFSDDKLHEVIVYSLVGQIVKSYSAQNQLEIALDNLPTGIYLISVDKNRSEKITKL